MFEWGDRGEESPTAAEVTAFVARLARTGAEVGDAERIDLIRALEELKAAATAAQAREVAAFATAQEAVHRARGTHSDEVGRGVAAQVGLAMRSSHHAAQRFTGFCRVLVSELPNTLGALTRGETTERRAFLVAQHTSWLPAEDRAAVDERIGSRLESLSDKQVEAEVKNLAYELDKAGYVARQRRAEADRQVTVRPAPDTMAYLTALLPVASAVACQAKLAAIANALRAAGDPRSRGQAMADALVDAITGGHPRQPNATDNTPAVNTRADDRFVPLPCGAEVEIKLVMTDAALLGDSDEPAHLEGHGPVPAAWVRDVLRRNDAARVWLRRLFTAPGSNELAAIETRRREFTGALRALIIARDQFCRQPWCGAPIRHIDHIQPHAEGGATSLANGQGLCEACNYSKQARGWRVQAGLDPGERHVVHITTPTGHRYTSRPPERTRRPLERVRAPA
jgi:hypothetical protein